LEAGRYFERSFHVVAERPASKGRTPDIDFSHEVDETLKLATRFRVDICDTENGGTLKNRALDEGSPCCRRMRQGTILWDIDTCNRSLRNFFERDLLRAGTGVCLPPTKIKACTWNLEGLHH